MSSSGRHAKLILLLGLTLPAFGASGPGYLATVGPAPLRFFSLPKPAPAPAPAATAPADANLPEMPNPYDVINAFNSNVNARASVPMPTTPQPEQTPNVDMNAATQPPQPGDVVSPQMLLKYFNKSTNGTGTGIIAPMDLSNPQPTQPPSSATYGN